MATKSCRLSSSEIRTGTLGACPSGHEGCQIGQPSSPDARQAHTPQQLKEDRAQAILTISVPRVVLLAPNVMIGNRRNLIHPLPSNAITLFDRKRMLSRLKLDLRSHPHRFSMNQGFQVNGVGITRNGTGKPTEVRSFVLSIGTVPKIQGSLEVFLA